jgi:hypothetical protein
MGPKGELHAEGAAAPPHCNGTSEDGIWVLRKFIFSHKK